MMLDRLEPGCEGLCIMTELHIIRHEAPVQTLKELEKNIGFFPPLPSLCSHWKNKTQYLPSSYGPAEKGMLQVLQEKNTRSQGRAQKVVSPTWWRQENICKGAIRLVLSRQSRVGEGVPHRGSSIRKIQSHKIVWHTVWQELKYDRCMML